MIKISDEIKKVINDFKDNYDIEEPKELNLKLSDINNLELGCCIYLVHKMVKDFEYYVGMGHNVNELISQFQEEYKELINEYIKDYCDSFTEDLYGKKFGIQEKKYVVDTINNKYDVKKCGIKSITKMLDAGFNSLLSKDKKEVKVVDFKKYKKEGVIVEKSDFDILQQLAIDIIKDIQNEAYDHPMYSDYSSTIMKTVFKTTKDVDKLFDIYEKNPSLELKNKIMHEINSLRASVMGLLNNAQNLDIVKDRCDKYIDQLVRTEYISKERALEFKDRIKNCKTITAVNKYNDILYNNYFYPTKARNVKKRLEKKVEFWIKKDVHHEELFNQLKEELFKKIDNCEVNKEELISIGEMGMEDAYDYIGRGDSSR